MVAAVLSSIRLVAESSRLSGSALRKAAQRLASNDAQNSKEHLLHQSGQSIVQPAPGPSTVTPDLRDAAQAGPSTPPVVDLSRPPTSAATLLASQGLGEDWNSEKYRAKSTRGGQHSQSSIEKKRQQTTRALGIGGLAALGFLFYHMGRPWEDDLERRKVAGEEGDVGHASRAWLRLKDSFDFFNKPAWDPLLPAPLAEPHQRPYTLCIDLDDLLVHSIWDRQHGWRTAKRPGVDYFLSYLSQFYEIVIFTSQPSYTALPIIEKLDPMNVYIPYKLFRESTRWVGSDLVKDLDYLGRDLKKVLILDTNAASFKLHPLNGVIVPKWDGRRGDQGLLGMVPFLEAVAILGVPDVRLVLKKYAEQGRSNEVYLAFAEEQARIKAKHIADWEAGEEQRKKSVVSSGMARWLGVSNPASPVVRNDRPPPTLLERERERAQQHWKQEKQYFAENAESIQKQMDEDRDRQLKEMKTSVFGFLSGNMAPQKAPSEGTAAPNV